MTTEIVASEAFDLDAQIHAAQYNVRANFIVLARLLSRMRDERLYTSLDCRSFEEYIGTLSPEFHRSWYYKLLAAWEKFGKVLAVPDARLIEIGPTKLDIIAPVVDAGNKDEWLDKAAALSKSDIINEVRQARGKPPLSSSRPDEGQKYPGLSDLHKYKSYLDYAREQPCIVCESRQVDMHHFPQGRARTDNMDKVVPLCRECHTGYHENPLKFMHDYKTKIFDYFYRLIFLIWGEG